MIWFPIVGLIILLSINILATIIVFSFSMAELIENIWAAFSIPGLISWAAFQLFVWGVVFAIPALWIAILVLAGIALVLIALFFIIFDIIVDALER